MAGKNVFTDLMGKSFLIVLEKLVLEEKFVLRENSVIQKNHIDKKIVLTKKFSFTVLAEKLYFIVLLEKN